MMNSTGAARLALVAIIVAILVLGRTVGAQDRQWAWLAIAGLMTVFVMLLGWIVTHHWFGVLIDERNKTSLSRFQMLIWTIILLSAFLTAVLGRIKDKVDDPLLVQIPETLVALAGISTISLVGSPLVRSDKEAKGQIGTKVDPEYAAWTDMFKMEDEGNEESVDLGKVQMFFFTLVLAFVYMVDVSNLFGSGDAFNSLPAFDDAMVALLGISHAGYLTSKAIAKPSASESSRD